MADTERDPDTETFQPHRELTGDEMDDQMPPSDDRDVARERIRSSTDGGNSEPTDPDSAFSDVDRDDSAND